MGKRYDSRRGPATSGREPPVIEGEATREPDPAEPPATPSEPAAFASAESTATETPGVGAAVTGTEPAPDAPKAEAEPATASEPAKAETPSAVDPSEPIVVPTPAVAEEPPVAPPPPPQPRRSGWAATVLGGVAILATAAASGWALKQTSDLDDAQSRLAATLAQDASRDSARDQKLAATDQRLAAQDQKLAALEPRLAAQEQRIAAIPDPGERLGAIDRRLAAIENRPAPRVVSPDEVVAMEKRVAAIESAIRATADAKAIATLENRLAQLEATPKPASGDAPAATPAVDLGPVQNRIAELEKAAAGPREALAAIEKRVAAMEAALGGPKNQTRVTEAPVQRPESEFAALTVVADAILKAIDRGDPFVNEISAAEKLAADPAKLAPLKVVAADGARSSARLAGEFRAVSRAVIDASRPKDAPAGFMDQIGAAASALVRVRRVGEPAGEEPSAIVARIEASLARGGVAAALADWQKLPEAGRAASRSWADAAKRRVDAETAARALLAAALADIGRDRSPR